MFKDFNKDKKRLISNFFSLSSIEIANYIFPLFTLPYLVRVLGPEKFGLVAFAQAFAQYFVMLTDYGFNLSATRAISINRDNNHKVSEIFSSVFFIKLVLMIVSFFILLSITCSIPKFRSDWLVYVLSFCMVIGNVLFPIWFFQGIERMKVIAALNLLAKLIFVLAIFVFVRKREDYIYVPLITSAGFIVAGLISLWIAFSRFKVKFIVPHIKFIMHELREGWHIFISTGAISLYTTSNTFILGLLTNNTIVGYYSAAEKLIRSGQRLLIPISQAIYPHISKLVADSKKNALIFIRKAVILIGGFSFGISLAIFIMAAPIVTILLGPQYKESILVLRILAFLPFIIALSNIFGIQTMLTFNMKEAFSHILITAGFVNIPLAIILVPLYKQVGISVSVLATEVFVTATMFFYLRAKGVHLFRKI